MAGFPGESLVSLKRIWWYGFAKLHLNNILWTDETKVELFGYNV